MMKKKNQKRLGNKGFSLVELIVVIAIMAVLVGVLAPTLISNIEKSRTNKDAQNIDTLRNAINVVLADEDYFPSLAGGTVNVAADGVVTVTPLAGATLKKTAEETATEICKTAGITGNKINPTSSKYKAAGTFSISSDGVCGAYSIQ